MNAGRSGLGSGRGVDDEVVRGIVPRSVQSVQHTTQQVREFGQQRFIDIREGGLMLLWQKPRFKGPLGCKGNKRDEMLRVVDDADRELTLDRDFITCWAAPVFVMIATTRMVKITK
jgi:hypothetical protein